MKTVWRPKRLLYSISVKKIMVAWAKVVEVGIEKRRHTWEVVQKCTISKI